MESISLGINCYRAILAQVNSLNQYGQNQILLSKFMRN